MCCRQYENCYCQDNTNSSSNNNNNINNNTKQLYKAVVLETPRCQQDTGQQCLRSCKGTRERGNSLCIVYFFPGQEHNFNRYKPKDMDFYGGSYDFSSIMHYGNFAFSKNKRPTMLSVKDPTLQFGQIAKLSPTDVIQLNNVYDCKCE